MNLLHPESLQSEPPPSLPVGTVFLAVLAPFTSIFILAAPLLFDAVRHAISL